MSRIIYHLDLNGTASNVRFADDAYSLASGEQETTGDTLPSISSLCSADRALTMAQAQAVEDINTSAEGVRMSYLTGGAGQALTYERKERESREWKAAAYAGTPPPFVQATANGRGIAPEEAADLIIAQADAWVSVGAAIEEAREAGNVSISAVASVEDAETSAIAAKSALETLRA